jgi:hypothetical protein
MRDRHFGSCSAPAQAKIRNRLRQCRAAIPANRTAAGIDLENRRKSCAARTIARFPHIDMRVFALHCRP